MKPLFHSIIRQLKPVSYPTLNQAFERYLDQVSVKKSNAGYSDKSLVKTWLNTPISNRRLNRIFAPDLVQLRDLWIDKYATATVVRRLAIFSHLYSIARTEWGYTKLQNPVQLINKPKIKNSRDRRLLTDLNILNYPTNEFDWLLRFGSNQKDWEHLLILAVETCMRRSEITSLTWSNIDLKARVLLLPKTKNGYERTVPLSPAAINTLLDIQRDGSNIVFNRTAGSITRLFSRSRKRVREKYETLCRKHNVQPIDKAFMDLRFHDLRHEAISRLAPHFQAHELARISGHRDTRMLMRYYHPNAMEFAARLAEIKPSSDYSQTISNTSSIVLAS